MLKFSTASAIALAIGSAMGATAQVNLGGNSYYGGATVTPPDGVDYFFRNRYTAADAHYYEGLDPYPVQIGVFEARPELLVAAASSNNVFLDDTNEVSDVIMTIAPQLSAATTWSRHRIGFDAILAHEEYLDTSTESATQYGLRGFGQLDINSRFAVAGSIGQQNARERRSSIGGTPNAQERIEFDRTSVEANALYATERVRLRGRVGMDEFDFSDGTSVGGAPLDQDFRDYDEMRTGVVAEYAMSRDWSLRGEVEHLDRDYAAPLVGQVDRDLSGYIVRAGTSFELPVAIRGQVSAEMQNFDTADPTLDDIEEFGINGNVQWFPTELTTISGYARRGVADAGNSGAANVVVSSYGAGVDHELLRTVILSGDLAFENRDFNPTTRQDDQTRFSLGATWKLNPNIRLRGGYSYITQDSDFDAFDENLLTVSVSFFP